MCGIWYSDDGGPLKLPKARTKENSRLVTDNRTLKNWKYSRVLRSVSPKFAIIMLTHAIKKSSCIICMCLKIVRTLIKDNKKKNQSSSVNNVLITSLAMGASKF